MTAGVLKQYPNTTIIGENNAIYYDKTQQANFRAKPPFSVKR